MRPTPPTLAAFLAALALGACGVAPPDLGEGSAPDLAGTEWLLISADGTDQVAGGRIAFGANGTASGNSGCNAFRGGYLTEGGALTFGPLAITRKACFGVADETERAFMAALAATRGAAIVGQDLLLIDARDRPVGRLTPL